jgi:hypothetical protein
MIVAEYVEHAVNDQPRQLFADGRSMSTRVLARDFRTNVDVPNNGIAWRCTHEPEGDHVGWAAVGEVRSIQTRDCPPTNERDRQQRVANAFAFESRSGDLGDSGPSDGRANVVG